MTAQGGWWSWLGHLNCYWMWECFTALNLLKLGQVPGTWTKNIYLSLFFFFPPKVFTYIDRTVVLGMSGKDVYFYRKCLHVALGLAIQAFWASDSALSSILPKPERLSLARLQFGSLHKAFGGSLPPQASFTYQNKELFLLGNEEFGLTDYFHEYSRASQTGLVLHASVPSHLSSPSPPPNLTPEALWVPSSWTRLCSFQLTAVLCAHTDLLLAWSLVSVNSFKAGTVILMSIPWGSTGIDIQMLVAWWEGGRENLPVE